MARWEQLEKEEPAIAEGGRSLIYNAGVPLGYLATVRVDDGLRIHPVCPIIHEGDAWLLIGNRSPKKQDLVRDGRYALHAFPVPEKDDEFMIAGRAERVDNPAQVQVIHEVLVATGAHSADHTLFRLEIDRALLSRYKPRDEGNTWPPEYLSWQA